MISAPLSYIANVITRPTVQLIGTEEIGTFQPTRDTGYHLMLQSSITPSSNMHAYTPTRLQSALAGAPRHHSALLSCTGSKTQSNKNLVMKNGDPFAYRSTVNIMS